jgi:hypothetical protein
MVTTIPKRLLASINLYREMYVLISSKRLCVRLTKKAVVFETSCVYNVLFVFDNGKSPFTY